MTYNIRMGIPEMAELWNRLQTSYGGLDDEKLLYHQFETDVISQI